MRTACYHSRTGRAEHGGTGRYGQRVTVLVCARRGASPRNALVRFSDGQRAVTSRGCLRWVCEKHGEATAC